MQNNNQQHQQADCTLLYNDDAERAVLGAMILETNAFDDVCQILTPDMFYSENNKTIYQTITEMHRKSIQVDMITVVTELKNKNLLSDTLNPITISELSWNVGSSAHIVQHALYIKQEFMKREVISIAQKAMRSVYSNDDVADVLSQMRLSTEVLEDNATVTTTLRHIRDIASESINQAERRVVNYRSGVKNGITTGLNGLDKITGGWQNGDLVIIAARPAMGKTALAIKFLESAGLSGEDVAMFALEMKSEKLVDRIILEKTGIQDWKYKQGSLTNEELGLVASTSNQLYSLPVYIDDNSSQTISRIKAKCRYLKKQDKCNLVIIDYLQLTEGEGSTMNREQEVAKISREAKKMAKSLNVPVIMLSQLNRASETRSDKRPQLSDIRESGAIEQDADMVMFIHRPEYYGLTLSPNGTDVPNGIELIIAKYREGAVGSTYLQHDGSVRNIIDYEPNRRVF